MRAVGWRSLLATFPFVGLFLFPLSSLADGDWRSDSFYEKLTGTAAAQHDLYGGEISQVHDYDDYYPEQRIDPRDRLYGGRYYYGHDYGRRYYGYAGGWRQPWYGQEYYRRNYRGSGWHCPPRYGRNDYYRYRSPW